MQSEYYETLLHKHLADELTSEEEQTLSEWLDESPDHRRQLEEAKRIWTLTATSHSKLDLDLEAEIGRFKDRIQFETTPANVIPLHQTAVWRYAAAAVILIGGIVFILRMGLFEPGMTTIETASGETQRVELPDGSTVRLNESSQLQYSTPFDQRTVQLTGEAFFDVERLPERPFLIESGIGVVQVLGTSFNVRNHPDEEDIRVTVASGRVALGVQGATPQQILEAGYLGIIEKRTGTISSQPNDNPALLSWRAEPLVFDATPFDEVVSQLQEYFAIRMTPPDTILHACTFTGQFDAPELDKILASISFSLNIQATSNQDVYAFSGEGCAP